MFVCDQSEKEERLTTYSRSRTVCLLKFKEPTKSRSAEVSGNMVPRPASGALVERALLGSASRAAMTGCFQVQVRDSSTIAAAAAQAHDHHRLVLTTTRGLKWALTALNAIVSLRLHGFDGVLVRQA